ncbi:MAG: hypothetical protein ACE5JC_09730 [Candidatus Zixiibacteriota bacterium]
MPTVCKFKFPNGLNGETIETQLALAIISAECAFGQPRVRISAGYLISKEKLEVAIDVSSEVGEHIAQVFTGLMTRQLGEEQFSVERVGGKE